VLAERRSAAALQVDAQTQLSFFTERALHSSDMFLMGSPLLGYAQIPKAFLAISALVLASLACAACPAVVLDTIASVAGA